MGKGFLPPSVTSRPQLLLAWAAQKMGYKHAAESVPGFALVYYMILEYKELNPMLAFYPLTWESPASNFWQQFLNVPK